MTQVFVGSFQQKSSLISKFPWLNLNFNFSWSKPNCHRTYTSWAFTMSCTGAEWCWSCGTSMDLRCSPNWKLFQSFPKKKVQPQSSKFSPSFVVKNPSQIPTFQGWEEALHGLDPEQLVQPTALPPALDVAPPVAPPPPSPSPSSAVRPRSPYLTSQQRRAERMPKAPWAGQRDHWGCWGATWAPKDGGFALTSSHAASGSFPARCRHASALGGGGARGCGGLAAGHETRGLWGVAHWKHGSRTNGNWEFCQEM